MTSAPLAVWANARLDAAAIAPHRLVAATDEGLAGADVAFGQPPVPAALASARLRWIHLSSAGWDRFDRADVREALRKRGVALTTSSGVFAEPCAQHALALLLAHARQLPRALAHQSGDHAWAMAEARARCELLDARTTVLLVGFGAIGARLAELLAPFGVRVVGLRRHPTGREPIEVAPIETLPDHLATADAIVDLLPGGPATRHLFDAAAFARCKPGAVFVNIGRGTTVDGVALRAALLDGRLSAALLDVTDPEPLPPDDPLWSTPGCTITPHAAGGHRGETEALAAHFVANLRRFVAGEPLRDRVV